MTNNQDEACIWCDHLIARHVYVQHEPPECFDCRGYCKPKRGRVRKVNRAIRRRWRRRQEK